MDFIIAGGPAYGAYILGATLFNAGYNVVKSVKDAKRAEDKRKEGLKLSDAEKKAMTNLRSRAQSPMPTGKLFNQGAKQISDTANIQKQKYVESATPYMEGSVVAKAVTETVDIKQREQLVQLSEKIAIQNASATASATDTLAKAQMQIGKAERDFDTYWDEKAYQAKTKAWGDAISFGMDAIGGYMEYENANALSGKIAEFQDTTLSPGERRQKLIDMLPYLEGVSSEEILKLYTYFEKNPQAFSNNVIDDKQ